MAQTQNSANFDDLFEKLGLSDLSKEEKEKRISEMEEVVESRVFLRLMNELSEDDKKAFDELESDEAFEKFMKDRNLDLARISFEEAVSYREELIANMSYLAGKMDKSE